MKALGGYSQKQLDDIWGTFSSDNPDPSANKVVDDDVEQVMTINTDDGQVSVSRKPGKEWFDTPSVGDSSFE
jgi:hypothetical protein